MNHRDDSPTYAEENLIPELRLGALRQAVKRIEQARERRKPKPRQVKKKRVDDGKLAAAFATAAREQRELQRLRATGAEYSALDFYPERIGRTTTPTTPATTATTTTTTEESAHGDNTH